MRIIHRETLISNAPFNRSALWRRINREIEQSIRAVVWPPESDRFLIHPQSGKKRGEGSGVVPIKNACMASLRRFGWDTRDRQNPLKFDAVKYVDGENFFGLEWETGNISSSHRAINRILRGHKDGILVGGAVVLPSRNLAQYLTDRVGNYEELEPYFSVWRDVVWDDGIMMIYKVEHDATDEGAPRIPKGTDGRALQ